MSMPGVDVWDEVAALTNYPCDASYVERVGRCADRLASAAPAAATSLAQLRTAIAGCSVGRLQERYTAAFDFDPACTLDVGWHLFSDGPDRGPWLASLREDLARAGVEETGELPDHLVHLLRLIAREDESRAATLAGMIAPAVQNVAERLAQRGNEFAGLVEAARHLLATRITQEGGGRD